jgi:hypothetical protein
MYDACWGDVRDGEAGPRRVARIIPVWVKYISIYLCKIVGSMI